MTRSRPWRQTIFAATVSLASLTAAAPALAEIEVPESAAPYFQGPEFEAAFEAEQQRLRDLWQRRTSPAGQQALEDSANGYSDLAAAAALELATNKHEAILDEPAFDPLAGTPASHVEGFAGDYGAIVDVPGEQANALIESTLPLRAEAPSGELEAVDNGLDDTGATLEPENPLAELELPLEISPSAADAIELPDIDVAVVPGDVSSNANADVVAGRAFYANAYADTDFIAGPVAGGLESFYQLRSAESPESFVLSFELPEGAELITDGPGAAIVSGDEELAYIAPPAASDADGFRVPVSYSVEGDTLVVEVSHRNDDWAYPILVDPTVTESYLYWNDGTTNINFAEWTYAENDTDFADIAGGSGASRGLYVLGGPPWSPTYPLGYFPYLAQASWSFNAPGTQSRIYNATFANVLASSPLVGPYNQPFHWLMQGVVNANSQWENGVTSAYGVASPLVLGGNISESSTITHCLDAQAPYCRDYAGTNDNTATLMSFTNPGGWPASTFYTFMGGASVSIADTIAPTMGTLTHTYEDASGAHQGLPSAWVDDASLGVVTEAYDDGLGAKRFILDVPGGPQRARAVACSGDRHDRCPIGAWWRSDSTDQDDPVSGDSFAYQASSMPEGVNTVSASSEDFAGNRSQPTSWEVKVDRSGPAVALSGPLFDASGANKPALTAENYVLDINATDGLPNGAASQQRSGVKSFQVIVDNEVVYEAPPQSCPSSSCGYPSTWTFQTDDYNAGSHQLKVVAFDQLGHPGESQALEFVTAPAFDDDYTDPEVTLSSGVPDPQTGNYQLTITATDAEAGVEFIEVFVDGESVQSWFEPCPGGGCTMIRSMTMSGDQSLEQHEIFASAEDGRGGEGSARKGEGFKPYELFGYNDDFANPGVDDNTRRITMLDVAKQGGANVIRFPISGCFIAQGGSGLHEGDPPVDPANPNTWRWDFYEPMFQLIRERNGDGIEGNDVQNVIIQLLDSPAWANDSAQFDACAGTPAQPDAVVPPTDDPPGGAEYFWTTFAYETLKRWGDGAVNLYAVEAWNEPNLPTFWGAHPSTEADEWAGAQPGRFAELVKIVHDQMVRLRGEGELEPSVKLFPGGTSPEATEGEAEAGEFLRRALPKIPRGYIDGISFHLFGNEESRARGFKRRIYGEYRSVVRALDDTPHYHPPNGSYPNLFVTEIGAPSAPGIGIGNQEANQQWQRNRLLKAYLRLGTLQPRVKGFLLHRLIDVPPEVESGAFGVGTLGEDNVTFSPKLAYCDLARELNLVPEACE